MMLPASSPPSDLSNRLSKALIALFAASTKSLILSVVAVVSFEMPIDAAPDVAACRAIVEPVITSLIVFDALEKDMPSTVKDASAALCVDEKPRSEGGEVIENVFSAPV